jgi:branched-chain amino acid transport system permease protein
MELVVQTLVSGLILGASYGLIAVGVTFVFGIGKIVNFAHGEFVMTAAYVLVIMLGMGVPWWLAMLAGVGGALIAGFILEITVVRRLYRAPENSSLLAMFALSLIMATGAQLFFGTTPIRPQTPFLGTSVSIFGANVDGQRFLTAIVSVAGLAALSIWLRQSKLGLQMQAVSQNPRGALYTGINVRRVQQIAFLLGIGLAGVAGVLLAPTTTVTPSMGFPLVVTAFTVVILGGLGSVVGAALGGLVIGILHAVIATYVSVQWTSAAGWMLIIIVLLLRPQGFFGQKPVRA